MILDVLSVGPLEENCYLVGDPDALLVIDPGDEGKRIVAHIQAKGYNVSYVVLTHCHYDHVGAVAEVLASTGAKLIMGAKEKDNYFDKNVTLDNHFGVSLKLCEPDELVSEGDVITSGTCSFTVIETPGHTSGSICLLCDDVLLSGDTLFYRSIGRADFPTGNLKTLVHSVKNKLFTLKESITVYSGHGPATTIGYEKEHNEVYVWERYC